MKTINNVCKDVARKNPILLCLCSRYNGTACCIKRSFDSSIMCKSWLFIGEGEPKASAFSLRRLVFD